MKTHLLLVLLLSQCLLTSAAEHPDTTLPVTMLVPSLAVVHHETEASMVLRFELPTAGNVTLQLADAGEKMTVMYFPGWHEAGVYEKKVSVSAFSVGDYQAMVCLNGQMALQPFKISR